MKKTIRINLVAPPNRGKTSLMNILSGSLKLYHSINNEIISEVAKEKAFDGIDLDKETLEDTISELKEQAFREDRFNGKVDCILTSSPLEVKLVYCNAFKNIDMKVLNQINNESKTKWVKDIYFYMNEDTTMPFEQEGRELWSVESSREFESTMRKHFTEKDIPLIECVGTPKERIVFMINTIQKYLSEVNKG